MKTGNEIVMIGMLLLSSACSGSPGADPDASTPAPQQGAATAQAGASTAEAPADGAASTTAADTAAAAQDDSAVTAQIESLLGSGSADEFKAAFKALQTAVAANDKAAVARVVDYPRTVSVGGQRLIKSADQFVAEYDRIITPDIAATITGQKFADMLVNTQGVMFGNGEVLLSGSCANEACSKHNVLIAMIQEVKQGAAEFPLTVDVTLSGAAARKLDKDGETLMVEASYFGYATPAGKDMADDLGMVDLGSTSAELAPRSHKAVLDGSQFKRDRLRFISGGARVNINISSGRHSSEDNILNCDMYEDSLATATSSPIPLSCKLLRGE